jgi:hypothetical protein
VPIEKSRLNSFENSSNSGDSFMRHPSRDTWLVP